MSSSNPQARVGEALVNFAVKSEYPAEEAIIAAAVQSSALPASLELLSDAKASLETEIRNISQGVAPDVDTWIEHAKTLQADIESSKRVANDIIRSAEADEHRHEVIKEQETYLSFLEDEVAFNNQRRDALMLIQEVYGCLENAETLIHERHILESLKLIEKAWGLIAKIPASRTAHAVRLLDARCFSLRETALDLLRSIWENLIVVNHEEQQITIHKEIEGEATDIHDAITSLTAYKKLNEEAKRFWQQLDDTILKARTDLTRGTLRSVQIDENSIRVGNEEVDSSIKSLFATIEDVIQFLVNRLPAEIIRPLSDAMMPDLSARLKDVWLDTAVPASLDELHEYQKSLAQVHVFAEKLHLLAWPGAAAFEDWISDAPKNWISKRRETALDWTRNQLALGIGSSQAAEHVERRMVGKDESKQIAESGNMANQDWDAAWDSEEGERESLPAVSNRASIDEERRATEVYTVPDDDDDTADDAWGWGDDDAVEEPKSEDVVEPAPENRPPTSRSSPETREITLCEKYRISSIPQPVLQTITGILNDGARLTSPEFEQSPVTPAAPILFTLPTMVLALYRSVSPYYYTYHPTGNMFMYNDSIWLCDKLAEFQSEWDEKFNLTSHRTYGKVHLEPEIKNLKSLGKRAYSSELTAQRTVITDLLGGAQNFFQQDGTLKGELEADIENAVSYIRTVSESWKPILAYSAWASSVGSLVNTVASKIITDVFDLSDVSVDDAERLAKLISEVIKMDDLFLRQPDGTAANDRDNDANGERQEDPIPMTAQFADKWLKLKYLSEVLQSNLNDIKFFWFEGELSLYFSKEEVIDLIGLSFENNANVRLAIKEIKDKPLPRVE